jgi:hypothetical protein
METFWYIISGIFIFVGVALFIKSVSRFVDSSSKKDKEIRR